MSSAHPRGMRTAIVAVVLASACSAMPEDRIELGNSTGNDDSVPIRPKLNDGGSVAGFSVGCDQPSGCEGHVTIRLKTPEPCALFPTEPRCGISRTSPLAQEVLKATIASTTEGERILPLRIESGDGEVF